MTGAARLLPIALTALLALAACDEPTPPPPEPPPEEADAEPTRTRPTAFGLPLPPRVLSIERTEREIVVDTDLSVEELAPFYEEALPNHEVLIVGAVLQAIALRPLDASVRGARASGPRSAVRLTYIPGQIASARTSPKSAPAEGVPRASAPAKNETRPAEGAARRARRRQGAPVELRTKEGTLLAPGARWGEPYTPPAGSPLDTPRNRNNFGRPFGDWRAD